MHVDTVTARPMLSGGSLFGTNAEAALFMGMLQGRAYLNIHSTAFPGGEIRGFLQPVPEPATLLLLGSGLVGIASRFRRSRKNIKKNAT
ncbi:MAG: CHRD domain-containing protein [Pyrinomonadaceae bacterium]